jgi:hypothetical protein
MSKKTMKTPADLCWAVLAPGDARTLKELALKAARKEWADTIFEDDDWVEIITGNGRYSAMVKREPGAEGTDIPFAKAFSRALKGPVYALRFDPEAPSVDVFENGKRTGERDEMPHDVAAELGVPLPKPATHADSTEKQYSVAVVEGVSVDEVDRALRAASVADSVHALESSVGTLVVDDEDDIGICAPDIASALPTATVYWVLHWAPSGELAVNVYRGDEQIGIFAIPPSRKRTRWDDVKGAREPLTVAAALGIPPDRLGLRG